MKKVRLILMKMKSIQVKIVILKRQEVKREHLKRSQINQRIKEDQAKVLKVPRREKMEVMTLPRITKSPKLPSKTMEMTQMKMN